MSRTRTHTIGKRAAACLPAVVVLALIAWFAVKIHEEWAERRGLAVEVLPAFEFVTLEGDVRRTTDFVRRGEGERSAPSEAGRPLILLFFQTTCAFCDHEIRHFVEHDSLLGEASVLLISNESVDVLRAFREALEVDDGARFTVVRDENGTIGRRFRVTHIPTLFVYGPSGSLLGTFRGLTHAEAVAAALAADAQTP